MLFVLMYGILNDIWFYMWLVLFLWMYVVKVVEWNCSNIDDVFYL